MGFFNLVSFFFVSFYSLSVIFLVFRRICILFLAVFLFVLRMFYAWWIWQMVLLFWVIVVLCRILVFLRRIRFGRDSTFYLRLMFLWVCFVL